MKRRSVCTVLMAVLAAWCIPAGATLIVDQSPPNLNSGDIVGFRLADDFTLGGPSVVDAINFWYQAQFQTDLSSVTYAIYANASGALGTKLFSGTVTPSTSFDSLNDNFFATLPVPNLTLSAGTYWLELHAGNSLTDSNGGLTVWWAGANDNATHVALWSATPNSPSIPETISGFEQYAFQLDGTGAGSASAPEPPATLLTGTGLAVLWWLVRKHSVERLGKSGGGGSTM
jgi:hypothetical protein